MIIFLTLCYVGLLLLLVKLNVIRFTLWWKLSPAVWMLILLIVLFIPMQWGAPSGGVILVNYVVEIIPNVSGEVVDVPVAPLTVLNKGDILFTIDPTTYEAEVERLKSSLAEAKTNVERLDASAAAASARVKKSEEQVDVLGSEREAAKAQVEAAGAAVAEAEASKNTIATEVDDRRRQLDIASRELARQEELFKQDAAALADVDRAKASVTSLEGGLNNALARSEAAQKTIDQREAERAAAEAAEKTIELRIRQTVEADVPLAKALELDAQLAANSRIGDVHTSVLQLQAQLKAAQYNLDQTIVRAPARGFVIGLTLRPGQRVANLPLRSWMAFVNLDQTRLVANIGQFALRHVEVGQPAEITFKVRPGETFPAVVDGIARLNNAGQVEATGQVPDLAPSMSSPAPIGVILKLDADSIDVSKLPGGALGSAAIYTDTMAPTHVIRKVMIRMDAWTNYIIPW